MTHLQIGKKLLAQTATDQANANLHTILHHLNMGLKMIADDEKLKQEARTPALHTSHTPHTPLTPSSHGEGE